MAFDLGPEQLAAKVGEHRNVAKTKGKGRTSSNTSANTCSASGLSAGVAPVADCAPVPPPCPNMFANEEKKFAEAFGWSEAWPAIELLYSQAVKTSYEVEVEDADEVETA